MFLYRYEITLSPPGNGFLFPSHFNSLEIDNIFVAPQYLAILFFLNNYNGHLPNLPGVVHDEKELTEVLKCYQKKVINSSKNVLEDLIEILQACKQEEYERIHFHFSGKIYGFIKETKNIHIHKNVQCSMYDKTLSGHGKDNARVLIEENNDPV